MAQIKRIVFCAERPDKGPSGGAAGVMYLLRKYLILSNCVCEVEYKYRETTRMKFVKSLIRESFLRKDIYYICHEPDSASILSLLRKRYSLIYHQQGPIVQEYINHTKNPKKFKIIKKQFIEKKAFLGADRVYFPSSGAADEYFNSKYASVKRIQVMLGDPLYNTINVDEKVIPIEGVVKDDQVLTFLSVGTMSELKGQDLTFKFIKSFVSKYTGRVRWITVGDGLIKQKIIDFCAKLSSCTSDFEHVHFDKIPHGSVLYLDSIADIYIMLHRSSIFDLATLEAMQSRCAIVLSNIGGNKDFNMDSNIILVDADEIEIGVQKFLDSDIDYLKKHNEQIFNEHFSPAKFSERYLTLICSIISQNVY